MTRRALIAGLGLITWATLQAIPPAGDAAPRYGAPAIGVMASPNPTTLAVGDFNDDDHLDIIVCNGTFSVNEIIFGNGDRTFEQPQAFDSNGALYYGAVGDLDEDGIVDFVSAGPRVYLSNGDGTFQPPIVYGAPNLTDVAVADLNGDHHHDVLLGGNLYAGFGDGTLDTARVLLEDYVAQVEVGFVDGDTLLDIVALRHDAASSVVLLNQGGWSFVPSDTIALLPGNGYMIELRVADMNGDDILDIVNSNHYLPGVGDGTFGDSVAFALADEDTPFAVDFDHDGIVDVLTDLRYNGPSTFWDVVRLRLGLGGGVFGPPVELGGGRSGISFQAGDFDADGNMDFVTATFGGSAVLVFHGNGDGTFGEAWEALPAGGMPEGVTVADAIGSGALDVVVAHPDSASLRVFPGVGDGTLGSPVDLATPGGTNASLVTDLNLDKLPDVVACGSGFVSVFPGLGGGALGGRVDYALPGAVTRVTSADLNGDTRPDILVAGAVLSVFITQPDGTLGARADYSGFYQDVLVGEITGDEHLDVVTGLGGVGSSYIYVWPGSATGALGASSSTNNGLFYFSLALAEVTGDEHLDAILLTERTFRTYPGKGDGTWDPFIAMPASTNNRLRYSRAVTVRDETDDGILDLVTANDQWHGFAIFPGLGGGQYERATIYGSGVLPTDLAFGDLDGDGRDEVAVANPYSQTVTIHRPLPLDPLAVRSKTDAASGLAFTRVWPVPSRGAIHVGFTLATDAPATLEVVDLAGRRLHREQIAGGAPGPRTLRIAPATAFAPGVYWVRLAQGAARASTRALVLD